MKTALFMDGSVLILPFLIFYNVQFSSSCASATIQLLILNNADNVLKACDACILCASCSLCNE